MKKLFSPSKFSSVNFHNHFKLIIFTITLSAFLFTGCKKDVQSGEPLTSDSESISIRPPGNSDGLNQKFGKLRVVTTASEMERGKPIFFDPFQFDQQYKNLVLRALKVTQPTCDDNTNLNQWLDGQLSDWNSEIIENVLNTDMLNLPFNYSFIFENRSIGQYFGKRGEYTLRLALTFIKLKHFWNINSHNMVLAAMHGNMLANKAKVYKTYSTAYELEPEDALYYTNVVAKLLQVYPQYRNGTHPIFTFNAFASPSFLFPPVGVIPAKIVMGDGIMEGFKAIGYDDVAPQAILAHEYGHQVQFQLGMFGDGTPEGTRRLELMADALSAYYLSHIRGEFMRWSRYKKFLQVFFNIGDCGTASPGHHGTPNQRMAAAEWGYEVAKSAERQGRILTSEVFTSMFEAELPQILTH